jgi:ABC-type glutathione transport system ATPase component
MSKETLLCVNEVTKRFKVKGPAGAAAEVPALSGISFSLSPQRTLALVGESGSGKSTLAQCIAGLERVTSGEIFFAGRDIAALGETQLRRVRPQIQLIFQDPANSLNPRWSALEIVSEPLLIQRRCNKSEASGKACELLKRVAIPTGKLGQSPGEFSGGQRQRLAIARALSLEPKLLILDEALSALDCSAQSQIANLLLELQASLGLTYLFITHDFALAAHLADEIAVMDRGRIAEIGETESILRAPQQEITRRLLAAVPKPFSARQDSQVR